MGTNGQSSCALLQGQIFGDIGLLQEPFTGYDEADKNDVTMRENVDIFVDLVSQEGYGELLEKVAHGCRSVLGPLLLTRINFHPNMGK